MLSMQEKGKDEAETQRESCTREVEGWKGGVRTFPDNHMVCLAQRGNLMGGKERS